MRKIFSLFALLYMSNTWAAPDLAKEMQKVFALLQSPKFETSISMQKKVTNTFSFSLMSKAILGKEAKKHTADLKWFTNTLQKIVTKTVYPEAPNFFQGVKISYEEVEKVGKNYTLLAVVMKRGEETEVLVTFSKVGKNWKIIDVAIDDESWVENIREQVSSTLKKKKWSGLKRDLNKRLADLEQKKGSK